MQLLDAPPLAEDVAAHRLLLLYQSSLEEVRQTVGDAGVERTRWVPRIRSLDEFSAAEIAAAHGRLIAAGFLGIQIEDRSRGMTYTVTPDGRAALSGRPNAGIDVESESAPATGAA